MEIILDWFAIRTKSGKLIQDTRKIATKKSDYKNLMEIVDIAQDENQNSYKFGATGKADFDLILNFDEGKFKLTVDDPKGNRLFSQDVDKAPFEKSIEAVEGDYIITVEPKYDTSVGKTFVLIASGKIEAVKEPTFSEDSQDQSASNSSKQKIGWILSILVITTAAIYIAHTRKKASGKKSKKT